MFKSVACVGGRLLHLQVWARPDIQEKRGRAWQPRALGRARQDRRTECPAGRRKRRDPIPQTS